MSVRKLKATHVVAIITALVVTAGIGVVLLRPDADDSAMVRATFADASPLVEGNLVKVDGVKVGLIEEISVRDGKALVEMEVEESALPLHADAKAKIRAKSLLGERYIDLDRGTRDAPVQDSPVTIDENNVSTNTDIQDVLNTLDDPTAAALSALVVTLGEGTDGQGKNIQNTLKSLAPAMHDTEKLGSILASQNETLASLVEQLTPVAQSVTTEHGAQLDRLVGSTEKSLSAVVDERVALDEALGRLPQTLRTARRTLRELGGVSKKTAGTLKSIRPLTDNLPEVTGELKRFAESADPALASLPGVLKHAEQLVDQARPLVRELGPGIKSLRTVSADGRHLVDKIQPHLSVVLDVAKFWALSTNGMDGLGNYFRGVLAIQPKALLQIPGLSAPNSGEDPTSGEKKRMPGPLGLDPELVPDVGLEDLGKKIDPQDKDKQQNPEKSSNKSAEKSGDRANRDSATGLSPSQEQSLLNMLLGGQG